MRRIYSLTRRCEVTLTLCKVLRTCMTDGTSSHVPGIFRSDYGIGRVVHRLEMTGEMMEIIQECIVWCYLSMA